MTYEIEAHLPFPMVVFHKPTGIYIINDRIGFRDNWKRLNAQICLEPMDPKIREELRDELESFVEMRCRMKFLGAL